jgi:glycine oxidase
MIYDLVVIGNGVIGSLCALNIKLKSPKLKIALIGKAERPFSASTGAGAMANVYAEIEKGPFNDQNEARYLQIGLSARQKWLNILNEIKIKKKIVTAKDTIVFLKKTSSAFEEFNYSNMQEVSKLDQCAERLNKKEIKSIFPDTYLNISDATKLKGEFALCTKSLFLHLDILMKENNIKFIDDQASQVNLSAQNIIEIDFNDQKKSIKSQKLIVAAGPSSANLFNKNFKIIPMLQGVGSAIILNDLRTLPKSFSKYVIRTVNRGGAQCGLHTVPRANETLYLGAGNYISKPGKKTHRLETIRYLYDLFTNELVGKKNSYALLGDLSIGYRPRTIDGFPSIGFHDKYQNIFFATGTNRVGLTWAPEISNEASNWYFEKETSGLFTGWQPNRKLIAYGSSEECIDYFVNSRISAGLEHGNFTSRDMKKMKLHFKKLATKQLKKIKKKYHGVNLNPDNWASLIDINNA